MQHGIQLVAYQPVKRQEVLRDAAVQEIAEAHGATAAQIALAWLLAQNALPIPKAVNRQHIDENVAAVAVKLSEQDLARLDGSSVTP